MHPVSSLPMKLRHPDSDAQRGPFLELTENLLACVLCPGSPKPEFPFLLGSDAVSWAVSSHLTVEAEWKKGTTVQSPSLLRLASV